MKKENKIYQNELLKRLWASADLQKEKQLLKQLFADSVFWAAKQPHRNGLFLLNGQAKCLSLQGTKKQQCSACLNKVIKKARKSRQLENFICPQGDFGLCLPLAQGDALYGFLILCNLKERPPAQSIYLFAALNSAILEKLQKELELSKLYQTIRPRAIALSTVHTVHRLISSSIDLEELLPRIARLSLQVLRAKRCVISLIDKKTQQLVPKAIIDLNKKGARGQISAKTRNIQRKVVHSGNCLLTKSYISMPLIEEEPIGVITLFQKINQKPFDNFDQEILAALSEQAISAIKNAQLYKEQEDMLLATVKSMSNLLKAKAPTYHAHSKAFVKLVLGIAKELGLSEEKQTNLRYAAMLHDAEKFGIPEEILKKPAQLSGKEFKIVQKHTKKSARFLSPLVRLKPVISVILHHHEKYDGTGYPDKLTGDKIPIEARIMAVADSFEAMISRRPYRKSTPASKAISEIKKHSGTQFDPHVIKVFVKLTKRRSFKKLFKNAQ